MEKILFYYLTGGELYLDSNSFKIIDKAEDNLISECGNEKRSYSLDKQDLDQIKKIIDEHKPIKELDFSEFPPVLDGSSNNFKVFYDGKLTKISAVNLWYYTTKEGLEDHKNFHGSYPENAMKLISLFSEIKAVLEKYHLNPKCFEL